MATTFLLIITMYVMWQFFSVAVNQCQSSYLKCAIVGGQRKICHTSRENVYHETHTLHTLSFESFDDYKRYPF